MSTHGPSLRTALDRGRASSGALVLAASLPVLFLAGDFQPHTVVSVGSAEVTIALADVAAVAVAAAALLAARSRLHVLRPSRWAWVVVVALLAWILGGIVTRSGVAGYAAGDAIVSSAKYAEYALLAPAVPLLLRTRRDLAVAAWVWVGWLSLAAGVGLLQLAGLDIFDAWTAWYRQPSFTGHHDLAGLSCLGLALATAGFLARGRWHPPGKLLAVGGAAGAIAMIVSGTMVGALGLAVGAAAATVVAWRTIGVSAGAVARVAALVLVVLVGVFAFRGGDVLDFARFLGIGPSESKTQEVESYSQRSVLLYIGGRIFVDHPVLGVGWQGSSGERAYGPYLADARARFPNVADEAFPAPGRPWGIQNAYLQAGADLGLPGAVLFLAAILSPAVLALRSLRRASGNLGPALVVLAATGVVGGLWGALGLVAGNPLLAVTWLLVGLGARLAATAEDEG